MIDRNKILAAIPDNSLAIVANLETVLVVGRIRGLTAREMGQLFGQATKTLDSQVEMMIRKFDPRAAGEFVEALTAAATAPFPQNQAVELLPDPGDYKKN